jgi:predicted DNA-binding transcriptional regulator YafY
MHYQRTLDIQRRLQAVLELIRSGQYSSPMLAERLGVSVPTVSRDITALRERGHKIRAQRTSGAWQYVLTKDSLKLRSSVKVAPLQRRYLEL